MLSVERNFVFQTAAPAHIPEIISLVSKTFVSREPLCRSLGITEAGIKPLFQEMVEKSVSMGLCLVATDLHRNRLAGTLIFQDFRLPYIAEPETCCPEASPVFSLLGELFQSCDSIGPDAVELHLAATSCHYPADRIASRLVLASHPLLREAGYKKIFSALTNPASQRAFLRFARRERSIATREFLWKGQKIFAKKPALPPEIVLASRRIDDPVTTFLTLKPVRAGLGRRGLLSQSLHRCFGSKV